MSTVMDHPQYTWRLSTAVDFFISLNDIFNPEQSGLRPSWAAGVRSRLPADAREFLADIFAHPWLPGHFLGRLAPPYDVRAALDSLAEIPPTGRFRVLAATQKFSAGVLDIIEKIEEKQSWNEEDLNGILSQYASSASKKIRRKEAIFFLDQFARSNKLGPPLIPALKAFYEGFFQEEEQRIRPYLQRAIDQGQQLAIDKPLPSLLEALSEGVAYALSKPYREIIFSPSFWSTPLIADVELNEETLFFIFGCRPEEESLIPGELIPDDLNRGLKALADPTRLKILHLLREKPLPPADIARAIRLRQATVTHHLQQLRQARLVRLTLSPSDRRVYAMRSDGIEKIIDLLNEFMAIRD